MEKPFNPIDAESAVKNIEHFSDAESAGTGAPKVILSDALFSGQRELIIRHMGQSYRLRRTQQEKLILTK
jgi:hemin uptake protein HemP